MDDAPQLHASNGIGPATRHTHLANVLNCNRLSHQEAPHGQTPRAAAQQPHVSCSIPASVSRPADQLPKAPTPARLADADAALSSLQQHTGAKALRPCSCTGSRALAVRGLLAGVVTATAAAAVCRGGGQGTCAAVGVVAALAGGLGVGLCARRAAAAAC
jgi:hypothetical protein